MARQSELKAGQRGVAGSIQLTPFLGHSGRRRLRKPAKVMCELMGGVGVIASQPIPLSAKECLLPVIYGMICEHCQ